MTKCEINLDSDIHIKCNNRDYKTYITFRLNQDDTMLVLTNHAVTARLENKMNNEIRKKQEQNTAASGDLECKFGRSVQQNVCYTENKYVSYFDLGYKSNILPLNYFPRSKNVPNHYQSEVDCSMDPVRKKILLCDKTVGVVAINSNCHSSMFS